MFDDDQNFVNAMASFSGSVHTSFTLSLKIWYQYQLM